MENKKSEYEILSGYPTYGTLLEELRECYAQGECPSQPCFTKENGRKIVRPLTIKETIEARVNEYNTPLLNGGKKSFRRNPTFRMDLLSSTGIAFKADRTKFKIIPMCKKLIEYPVNEDKLWREHEEICYGHKIEECLETVNAISIDYEHADGIELEMMEHRYGGYCSLEPELRHNQKGILESYFWNGIVEGDKALLKEYSDIVFSAIKQKYSEEYLDGMGGIYVTNDQISRIKEDSFLSAVLSSFGPLTVECNSEILLKGADDYYTIDTFHGLQQGLLMKKN